MLSEAFLPACVNAEEIVIFSDLLFIGIISSLSKIKRDKRNNIRFEMTTLEYNISPIFTLEKSESPTAVTAKAGAGHTQEKMSFFALTDPIFPLSRSDFVIFAPTGKPPTALKIKTHSPSYGTEKSLREIKDRSFPPLLRAPLEVIN